MKRIIQLIIIITFSIASWGQCTIPEPTLSEVCEDGKGIRTNPDNPLNCEGADNQGNVVPWRQNNFEWRIQNPQPTQPVEYYDIFTSGLNGAGQPNTSPVMNPYTGPSDAEYYGPVTFAAASNYQPLDGWELMKVEFGSPTGSADQYFPKLPYMMLYNKYSGTLRFFGALMEPNTTYKTIEVKLSIPRFSKGKLNDATSNYQPLLKATNLLSIQGESIQPLDQETDENTLSAFVQYTNNDENFFWFDVPLAYDPCICQFKSQFNVSFEFVQVADIDIVGDMTGSIKTTTTSSGSYASKVFGKVLAAGVSTATAIATGGAVVNVKAFVELIDVFKDNPNTSANDKANLGKLKGALNCGADLFDVVKGNYKGLIDTADKVSAAKGKKLLDGSIKFFSSAAKGCQGDKSATAISGRITATGTVTQTNLITGTTIELAVPGSKWDVPLAKRTYTATTGSNKLVPAYPLYNERLGTFALLKTPEISILESIDTCSTVETEDEGEPFEQDNLHMHSRTAWSMKLTSDLEYSFNPVLNLNSDKTLILARIVVNKNAVNLTSNHQGTFSVANGECLPINQKSNPLNMEYLPNSEYKIVTPYMPIDYVKSMPMRFSWKRYSVFPDLGFFDPETEENFIETRWNDIMTNQSFEGSVFVQFTIVAESNSVGADNDNNLLYQVLTFPVQLNNVTSDPNGAVVNGNYVQSTKNFNTDETFTTNTDLFFVGPVFISAKLSTSAGAKLRIYSLNGFEIEPGADISPEVELIPGPHLTKDEQLEATYTEVSSFCSTNDYKAKEFSTAARRGISDDADRYNEQIRLDELEKKRAKMLNLNLYPNPTRGEFTLAFDYALSDVSVSVLDINGKEILTQNFSGEQSKVKLDASQLEAGIYFIDVRTLNGKIGREKLIKY